MYDPPPHVALRAQGIALMLYAFLNALHVLAIAMWVGGCRRPHPCPPHALGTR
jgi:hypothetical protein